MMKSLQCWDLVETIGINYMGRPWMTARFVPTASGPAAVGGGGAGGGGGGGGLYQFANGESFTFNAGGQTGSTARSISSMRSYYTVETVVTLG